MVFNDTAIEHGCDPWDLVYDALEEVEKKVKKAKQFAKERRDLDLDNPEDDRL
jgi:7,8-dihydro-6-hydroxymethylpterin-pyrophosphokinase